jgi:hypothetical protein
MDDTWERAYKIKNFIKELPTYSVLFERSVNGIESALCLRCEKVEEDWEHVWKCEANPYTVNEVIVGAIEDYEYLLKEKGKIEEMKILRKINIPFIKFMQEASEILTGFLKEWEFLRGVYNNKLKRWQQIIHLNQS